mgnify:CR=1 FL=1
MNKNLEISEKDNLNLEGFKFLRPIPQINDKNNYYLNNKINNFFSKTSNIFYERKINWPINTVKHFDYAIQDCKKILRCINEDR